ncbi:MAG: methylmalonyl-CoA mutase family protein [Rhodomicrobium sp.]
MDDFSLAGHFPDATEAEWRALAANALRGQPFDTLRTRLPEGIDLEPLYTARAGRAPVFNSRGWSIVQPLLAKTAGDACAQVEDALSNGAGAISIDFDANPSIQTCEALKPVLKAETAYWLTPGATLADAALLLSAMEAAQLAPAGTAGFDPLTAAALAGEIPAEGSAFHDYVDAAFHIQEHFPNFVTFLASGHVWDGAGGSAVQELAFTLAAGVSYWRALAAAGMPHPESAGTIGFSLTTSADIFLTIAKFRAMRLLWARALEAAATRPKAGMLLHAKMSRRILTAYDPHSNILRGTAAAFGAAIGGASAIDLLPFDSAAEEATPFGLRLARNTSLILQHESFLTAVADAGAGSAYIDALTNELAAASWDLFREVEGKGGLAAVIQSGWVYEQLLPKLSKRERAVAFRRDRITGVSVFPNLSDQPPATSGVHSVVEDRAAFASQLALPPSGKGERFAALIEAARRGAALKDLRMASRRVMELAGSALPAMKRDAEGFEQLRRRADTACAHIGSRPPLFLAILGDPEDYSVRASWVQGVFAAGGLETLIPEEGFKSVEALVSDFKQSPAPIACLCSSDRGYADMKGAAVALRNAGALAVYLAASASILKDLDPADATAVTRLVHEGANILGLLEEAHRILRVEELSEAAVREAEEEGFALAGVAAPLA